MLDSYDALIFDCDGVLVNSEEIVHEVELAVLAAAGMTYTRAEFVRRFMGVAERQYRDELHRDARERFATSLTEQFFDDMNAAIRRAIEARLEIVHGAAALVAAWPKRNAVASSSSLAALHYKLRVTGLDTLFGEHVYSADLVHAGKPDPAVFLLAAERLGVRPERCLVVEDSANGVVAAKRAGMTAAGFTGGGHCLDDHVELLSGCGADVVFATHSELAAHLNLTAR